MYIMMQLTTGFIKLVLNNHDHGMQLSCSISDSVLHLAVFCDLSYNEAKYVI